MKFVFERKRRLVAGALALVAALAVAGAAAATSQGGVATKTLTIAFIGDLTGPYAAADNGPYTVAAAEAAFAAQNADGGIDGYRFKVQTYDTASTSAGGVSAIRQAIQAKPFAIATNSSLIGSGIQLLVQSKIPVFSDGDLPNFPGPGNTNLFGYNGELGTRNTTAWAKYCTAHGRTKFAIPGSSIPGVAAYAQVWAKVSTASGGTVTYSKIGIDSSNTANIQATAQEMIASGANCAISLLIPGSAQLQVDINQLGGNIWVLDPSDYGPAVEAQYGAAADGLIFFGYYAPLDNNPKNKGVQMYLADMKKYAGATIPARGNQVEGFETALYLMHAISLVKGPLTQAKVIAAGATIKNYTIDGLHGPFSNPAYQNGTANALCGGFEVLTNGKWKGVLGPPANKAGFVCGTEVTLGG